VERIVITGASGFIGSNVSKYLENKGFEITRVSRKPGDRILKVADYKDTPEGDFLIHLAESPIITVENEDTHNTEHNDLLLSLAEKSPKIIYASSSAVYGSSNNKPNKISDSISPVDNYSKAKLANEKIVLTSNGIVLRLSNIFGKGMSSKNIFSDILSQIPNAGPLFIRNDKPVRDFLYINEVCEIIYCIIKNFKSGVCNAGSGTGISIGDLARLVLDLCNESDRSIKVTNPDAGFSINILDIGDTTAMYGWKPSMPLEKQIHTYLKNRNNQ
jgi:UDP-glucose 4-epimerase